MSANNVLRTILNIAVFALQVKFARFLLPALLLGKLQAPLVVPLLVLLFHDPAAQTAVMSLLLPVSSWTTVSSWMRLKLRALLDLHLQSRQPMSQPRLFNAAPLLLLVRTILTTPV